jgi:hypothetical protein
MMPTGPQWHNGRTEFRENLSHGSEFGKGEVGIQERTRGKFGDIKNLINLQRPLLSVLPFFLQ